MKSLYIHIPFCKSICSYCDFAKMFYNEFLALSYLDELSNEVNNNYKQDMLETIYIGGGTPSILSKKELNKLFSITNKLNIEPNYEFTIEANIADINEEFLSFCKSNKVNRLSIGIETINDKFYKFLNRENNIEDIKNKILLAKKYFSNITSRERAIFEGAISMGALFHQFVGTPVNKSSKKSLETSMEESLKLQPAIEDVDVKIRFDKLEESMSDFDYTSLTGDMLDVKIYTKVKDVQATIRIEFIEELNYPLMYVEDIN